VHVPLDRDEPEIRCMCGDGEDRFSIASIPSTPLFLQIVSMINRFLFQSRAEGDVCSAALETPSETSISIYRLRPFGAIRRNIFNKRKQVIIGNSSSHHHYSLLAGPIPVLRICACAT
jgi:hypothetical protein